MKKVRNLTMFAMVLFIGAGVLFAGGGGQKSGQASGTQGSVTAYNLPRNETLYYNGLQWGAPRGNNPYAANANNALTIADHRQLFYETLFAYNMLDGQIYPQIADKYDLSGQTLTVQINPNVKFSNGTPLTSADVVNSFQLSKTYTVGASGVWDNIDSITAQGDYTVVIQAKAPPAFNVGNLLQTLATYRITSKAYWDGKIASGDLGTGAGDLAAFTGWDSYGTGPYMLFYYDDTKVVLIRNDSYWGQHASRYGKLPVPKYIAHNAYKDNASGDEALRRNEVDVSQQFTAQIWTYFNQGVETYIPQAPYYVPGGIPSIYFNVNKPGLDDFNVRKALAMVIDFDLIGTNAMSGYTAPKEQHMMLPTTAEKALIDEAALKPYQWTAGDVAGANALLDQAGWARGTDGVRAKGGVRLSFRLECPYGWSDWNATLEVVAQAGQQLGMDLTTYYPEQAVWTDDRNTGNFDIIMDNSGGAGMNMPWGRARFLMGSSYLPTGSGLNTQGNWGRWVNADAQRIIDQIAGETNAATLKTLWTQLNVIYLQNLPSVGLMYRPWLFHQVNNKTWTGFPKLGDGSNVPPQLLSDGYGIKGLYNIRLAGK